MGRTIPDHDYKGNNKAPHQLETHSLKLLGMFTEGRMIICHKTTSINTSATGLANDLENYELEEPSSVPLERWCRVPREKSSQTVGNIASCGHMRLHISEANGLHKLADSIPQVPFEHS